MYIIYIYTIHQNLPMKTSSNTTKKKTLQAFPLLLVAAISASAREACQLDPPAIHPNSRGISELLGCKNLAYKIPTIQEKYVAHQVGFICHSGDLDAD